MSIHRILLFVFVLGFIAACATGCVVHRTVSNGNEVVSQGYVVKSPLAVP